MDPVSLALVTWATGQAAASALGALERSWRGDPLRSALTKITREAVVVSVEETVAAPERAVVAEALTRNYGERSAVQPANPVDLRQAMAASVGPVLDVLGDQGYNIDGAMLIDCLVTHVASGVRADAARKGILRPLANLMAQDVIVQELMAIRAAVDGAASRAAPLVKVPGSAEALRPPPQLGDVQIAIRPWLGLLAGRDDSGGDIADRLLAADPGLLIDKGSRLYDLQALASKAFSIDEISVAVAMASEPVAVRVSSLDDFWAAVIADFALRRSDPKSMKWLLQQTVGSDGRRASLKRLDAVWEFIRATCLSPAATVDSHDVMERLVDACLQTTGRNRQKGLIRFLLSLAANDPALKLTIRQALEEFCQTHEDLTPERMGDLIRLVGDCGGPATFLPDLVAISPAGSWSYGFEVMRTPLTVGEARVIFPGLTEDGANPQLPFRFASPDMFASDREFYANLQKELMIILLRVYSQNDERIGMRWDVPTYPEWLRLAGCEHQRFPWGDTFDRPDRANLRIAGRKPRLHPVGSFRAGATANGIQDCCGNVYEIVRLDRGEQFPHSFGLIGQSYRTPADEADCRHLGCFWPRRHDHRRNVGVRLIRYLADDDGRRVIKY